MSPPLLLVLGAAAFVLFVRVARWPFPLALAAAAIVTGTAGTLDFPFRHFVEGTFGYFNLILALFAGAWFGQVVSQSGLAMGFAGGLVRAAGLRPAINLGVIAILLFAAGMFTGVAGVAVLTVGAFAAPVLRRIGLASHDAAAFIALEATCGMIAPPVNVPAMMIADGVNMPFLNFDRTLLLVSLPVALFTVVLFARRCGAPPGDAQNEAPRRGALTGALPLLGILGFWLALRAMPTHVYDPGVPVVLAAAGLLIMPLLGAGGLRASVLAAFSGTPLFLAAALAAVGMLVQVMTLTGMRGWVVMQTMASDAPWLHLLVASLPVFGGVLTSAGTANILGVPFAFAFIHQDMIINVSALSSIAAISEFMPPTAIGAALAGYVVGEGRLLAIVRAAWPPLALLFAISLLLLVFAKSLVPWLTA
jgi:TRAP-type C4-dicarboxylate transport system permease large subunit